MIRSLNSLSKITVEAWAGEHISNAAKDAAYLAQKLNRAVWLRFNDTEVSVGAYDSPNVVMENWDQVRESK